MDKFTHFCLDSLAYLTDLLSTTSLSPPILHLLASHCSTFLNPPLRNIILTTLFSLSFSSTSGDTLFSIFLSLFSDYIGFLANNGLDQGLQFTISIFYIFCSSSGTTVSVLQLPSENESSTLRSKICSTTGSNVSLYGYYKWQFPSV